MIIKATSSGKVYRDGTLLKDAPKCPDCKDNDSDCDERPSTKEMAIGFAESVKAIVKSGIKVCNEDIYDYRHGICKQCEQLEYGRCDKCGCFMRVKAKFAAMSCPVGKWEKQ